jgi:hypoxanthine phosphoribosyltransferase
MILVTRGGIIPGGLLAEALDIRDVLTAAVHFQQSRTKRACSPCPISSSSPAIRS